MRWIHGSGLRVRGRQHRRLERFAPEAGRAGKEQPDVDLGVEVRDRLQHSTTLAQDLVERPVLAPAGIGGRQLTRPEPVAVELVPRVGHGGHAEEAGVQGVAEHRVHLRQFAARRGDVGVGGTAQPHHVGAHVGVAEHRRDVRAERARLQLGQIGRRIGPRLRTLQRTEHLRPGQRLDAAEQIGGVQRRGVHGGERAVANQHGGDAVPHRLGQPRGDEHLGVVVGVDVDEPGRHPLAGRVDHLGAAGDVERRRAYCHHALVADAEVTHRRRGAGAVEVPAVGDDEVEGASGEAMLEDANLASDLSQYFTRITPVPSQDVRHALLRRPRAVLTVAATAPSPWPLAAPALA